VIVLAAAAFGCIQADGVPATTPDRESARPAPEPGAMSPLWEPCKGAAGEPRDRSWACLALAEHLEQGVFGLPRDPARAAELRQRAIDVLEVSCDQGDVADCTRAAMTIGALIGREDDAAGATREAAGWMVAFADQGCRGGDATGCALLGLIYEGWRGLERNEARSKGYYDRACSGGHLPSCLILASGAEGPAAVTAYERACRTGSGFGCAAAAQHHARGVGVAASLARATELFEQGCSLGNTAACVMGAELLDRAQPGERRAMRLAWEACSMGIPDGCLLLGAIIEREKGPPRAFEVYHRACELGDKRGCAAERRVRAAGQRGLDSVLDVEGDGAQGDREVPGD
jgi:TPR repeat protein